MKCMLCGNKTAIMARKYIYGKELVVCAACDIKIDALRQCKPKEYKKLIDQIKEM